MLHAQGRPLGVHLGAGQDADFTIPTLGSARGTTPIGLNNNASDYLARYYSMV